jgi:hypothetical protein
MPFGSFKTVDYTYVPKHNLQVIGQTYDYLQNRHDVAVAQESELKKQIGQLELNAQEDEFKQLLVNNVQSKINDAMIDDFKGYALDDIVAEAGNLMSDPRVLGRLRAQQQYKAYQDNLNARTDLSEDYKNYYRQANTYHYEDKLDAAGNVIGGTEWKPAEQEVSEIPTSVIYNEALKIAQADAGGGESYSFLDANGKPTNDFTKSATGEMFMKSGNKWERLSEDKLQHAIDAAIEGTPGAKASLQQDYKIAMWKDQTQGKNADVRDHNGNLLNEQEFINRRFNNFIKAATYNRVYSSAEFGTALQSARKLAAGSSAPVSDMSFPNQMYDAPSITVKNQSAINARGNIQSNKAALGEVFTRNGINADVNTLTPDALRQQVDAMPNGMDKLIALKAVKAISDDQEFLDNLLGVQKGTEAGDAFEMYTALSSGTDLPANNQFRTAVNEYTDAAYPPHVENVRAYLRDDEYASLVKTLGGDEAVRSLGVQIGKENGMNYVQLPRDYKDNLFIFSKAIRDARNENTSLLNEIGRSFDAITRGFGYFNYDKTRYFANVVTLDKDGNVFDKLDTNLPTRSWNYGANTTLGGVLNNFADFGDNLNQNAEAIIQQEVTIPTQYSPNATPAQAQAEYNIKHGIGKREDNNAIMNIEDERFYQGIGNIDLTQSPNTYIYDEDLNTYREMDTEEELKYTNLLANAKENVVTKGITPFNNSIQGIVSVKDPKKPNDAPKRIRFDLNPVMTKEWMQDTNIKAGMRTQNLRSYKQQFNIGNSPYDANIGKYRITPDLDLVNVTNNQVIRSLSPMEAQDLIEKSIRLEDLGDAYVTGNAPNASYTQAIINSISQAYSQYLYGTTDYAGNISNIISRNLTNYR